MREVIRLVVAVRARLARGSIWCPVTLKDVMGMIMKAAGRLGQAEFWRQTERFIDAHAARDADISTGVLTTAHLDLKCPPGATEVDNFFADPAQWLT